VESNVIKITLTEDQKIGLQLLRKRQQREHTRNVIGTAAAVMAYFHAPVFVPLTEKD
jgi:hypothetical protein